MNSSPVTELLFAFWSTSWRASLLILTLVLLRWLARGKIPAQIFFAAWIVVSFRLLLPFSLPAAWSPYNWFVGRPEVVVPAPGAAVLPATLAPATSDPLVRPSVPTAVATPPVPEPAPLSRWEILAPLWLGGGFFLLSLRLLASWRFRRQLRAAVPIVGGRIERIVAAELTFPLMHRPRCYETDAVRAPALFGMIRPRLLFPTGLVDQLTDEELRFVVRHELSHWRRYDLLALAVIHVATIVHWFNPLVWVVAWLARIDCELACDESVLGRKREMDAPAYAAALLKVLGVVPAQMRLAGAVALLENKRQLAHRLSAIAAFEPLSFLRLAVGFAIVLALGTASMTREANAADRAPAVNPVPAAPGDPTPAASSASAPARLVATATDAELLAILTDRIQPIVRGTTTIRGAQRLLVGSSSFEDGTVFTVEFNGQEYRLDLIRFDAASFTLRYKGAEVTRLIQPAANPSKPGSTASAAGIEEVRRQEETVQQLRREIQAFMEANGGGSLDLSRDLLASAMKSAAAHAGALKAEVATSEVRLEQIREYRAKGADLTVLPFFVDHPQIVQLKQQHTDLRMRLANLSLRYAEQHPEIKRANNGLQQTEQELAHTLEGLCRQLEANHEVSLRVLQKAEEEVKSRAQERKALERTALEYDEKMRALRNAEKLLRTLTERAQNSAQFAPPVRDPGDTAGIRAKGGAANREHVLRPQEVIQVEVFQEPDLTKEVRVSEDGKVVLPLVGAVDLGGKSIRQAEDQIRQLYVSKGFLIHAEVSIAVVEHAARSATSAPATASADTYTLIALESVFVRVTQSIPPDTDGEEIFKGMLAKGQTQVIPWTTAHNIWSSAGENTELEYRGKRYPLRTFFTGYGHAQMEKKK